MRAELIELAGGPWIVALRKDGAWRCAVAESRLEAWRKACAEAGVPVGPSA